MRRRNRYVPSLAESMHAAFEIGSAPNNPRTHKVGGIGERPLQCAFPSHHHPNCDAVLPRLPFAVHPPLLTPSPKIQFEFRESDLN